MIKLLRAKYNNLSGIHQRIFSGAFWSLFGSVVSKIMVLGATIVVARILTKEAYGELGMVRSTIGMFMAFSTFSIGATASKYIAEFRERDKEYAVRVYIISLLFSALLSVIFGIVVLATSNYIALHSFDAPHLASVVRVAAIILVFTTLAGAQTGVLAGFEDFKAISTVNVIFGFCESIMIIVGAYFADVVGVIWGFGLANLLNFILLHISAKRHIAALGYSVKDAFSKTKIGDLAILYKFSLPATISSILAMVFVWYSKTILVKESGFEAMATFDIAEQWRTQLLFIPAAISQIVLPILSNSKHSNDQISVVKTNVVINTVTTSIIALMFLCFGKLIMSVYGSDYTNAVPLYVMGLTGVVISISNVLGSVCFANDKAWQICLLNGVQGLLLVLFAKYFIGAGMADTGLALANLISYIIFVLLLVAVTVYVLRPKRR